MTLKTRIKALERRTFCGVTHTGFASSPDDVDRVMAEIKARPSYEVFHNIVIVRWRTRAEEDQAVALAAGE